MGGAFKYITLALIGLALGAASALWMSGLLGPGTARGFSDVEVAGWATDRSIGAPSADAYTRARVARHGLLALTREEAIYFTRNTDDAGDRLRSNCIYTLSGGPQDALWWSITLYDGDSRLPMNSDGALSIDATRMGNDGPWTATIAPARPESGAWLSSNGAERFDLTLRLYRPAPAVIEAPEDHLSTPQIRKISCDGAA